MSSQHKSAFTHPEILVVIAITGIIAAVVIPVFARSRENARRSNCQSNLKQIALGLKQYAQDYDSRYPKSIFGMGTTPRGWADAIQPYIKSTQLLQCPSEKNAAHPDPNHIPLPNDPRGYTDYAYNANLTGKSENQLVSPVSTILACEGITFASEATQEGNDTGSATGCEGDSTFPGATPRVFDPGPVYFGDMTRHLGGGNYAFADGHVKWLLPDKIHNWCTAPNNNATFAYK